MPKINSSAGIVVGDIHANGDISCDSDSTVGGDLAVTGAVTAGSESTFSFLVQSDPAYDDIRVPLESTKAGAAPPTWTQLADDTALGDTGTSTGVYCWGFPTASETEVHFTVQLPHSYKQGTAVGCYVHWIQPEGTTAKGVRWGLEYNIAAVSGTFGATSMSLAGTGTTGATAGYHHKTSLGSIAGTGLTISTVIVCRLFRDHDHASDDYAQTVLVPEVVFNYQIDTLGSRTATAK